MESITTIDWSDPGLVLTMLMPWAIRIGIALAIFIVGRWIARWLTNMVRKVMTRSNMDEMLINFLGNIIYMVLLLAVVMAALDNLGIQTTSLLAVFGAAGLAVVKLFLWRNDHPVPPVQGRRLHRSRRRYRRGRGSPHICHHYENR